MIKKITLIFMCWFFLFSAFHQVFAYSTIHVQGKVRSYSKGVYHIQTDKVKLTVERSKLHPPHIQSLKMTGKQIDIRIPASAILSYKKIKTLNERTPASSCQEKDLKK